MCEERRVNNMSLSHHIYDISCTIGDIYRTAKSGLRCQSLQVDDLCSAPLKHVNFNTWNPSVERVA